MRIPIYSIQIIELSDLFFRSLGGSDDLTSTVVFYLLLFFREKIAAQSARTSVNSRASSSKDDHHDHPPSSKPDKGKGKYFLCESYFRCNVLQLRGKWTLSK